MIVTTAQRPDLVEITAGWAWNEWWRKRDRSFDDILARHATLVPGDGFERCLVLLDGDAPVAMASLVRSDLEERPDLTPWLAGVFVDPAHRGRGHGIRVVRAVEAAALAAGVGTLWLYTSTAAPLYRRMGWVDHAMLPDRARPTWLMCREPTCNHGEGATF